MAKEYVAQVDGHYRIAGTRLSLDSLVYLFEEGLTVEAMIDSYPGLSYEQVFGAMAFYLANKADVDSAMRRAEAESELQQAKSRQDNATVIAKLKRARESLRLAGHVSS